VLNQRSIQETLFKYYVKQAQLTGSRLEVLLALARLCFSGKSNDEIKILIDEMILKFFEEKIGINLASDFFESRIDNGLNVEGAKYY
jgi:hypothetical protein